MRITDLRHRLRALGAGPMHEERVLRLWAQARPQDSGRRRIDGIVDQKELSLAQDLPVVLVERAHRGIIGACERCQRMAQRP